MTACRAGLLAAVLVVFLPSLATASPVDGHGGTSPVPVAGGLRFEPAAGAEQWRLTVSGPGGYYVRRPISGSGLTLSLAGEDGVLPLDGSYLWELQALAGNRPVVGETRSGAFRVRSGEILLPDAAQVEPGVT